MSPNSRGGEERGRIGISPWPGRYRSVDAASRGESNVSHDGKNQVPEGSPLALPSKNRCRAVWCSGALGRAPLRVAIARSGLAVMMPCSHHAAGEAAWLASPLLRAGEPYVTCSCLVGVTQTSVSTFFIFLFIFVQFPFDFMLFEFCAGDMWE